MATTWTLTVDCASPSALAQFWMTALGYVEAPVPEGFASWEEWLTAFAVPKEEWDDGASIVDPDGIGPRISFLKVPEPKTTKNRVHIDIQAGGGRANAHDVRWPRIMAAVERLIEAGAVVVRQDEIEGVPDHMVMADPEGIEFCVV
jgi:hypothetical protein